MEKEFGKLSVEQFKRLIEALPELREQGAELRSVIGAMPRSRLDAILQPGFHWGAIYECSFHEHLAVVVYALGMAEYLHGVARSSDPQQRMLDDMARPEAMIDGEFRVDERHVLGLGVSLQRTLQCVMLYQRSLSSLVQEVRENDSMEALFKAVRVDRSVVVAPTIADKISRAEMIGDERFFRHLRSALKGPQRKTWDAYRDLRYALAVLRELGFDRLSDAQLESLLVDQLRLYPSTPAARRNLRAQYQFSRKIKTI